MNKFYFSKTAIKSFQKIPKIHQKIINTKLFTLKKHKAIFSVLLKLKGVSPVSYRLRVGRYRIIIHHTAGKDFIIVDIGHRKNIYR